MRAATLATERPAAPRRKTSCTSSSERTFPVYQRNEHSFLESNAKRGRRQDRIVQSTPSASGCVMRSGQRPAEAKRRSGLSDVSGAVGGSMPAPYMVSSLRRRRVVSHQARPTSAVTTAARTSQRWP